VRIYEIRRSYLQTTFLLLREKDTAAFETAIRYPLAILAAVKWRME
jgi:hypothetical protein